MQWKIIQATLWKESSSRPCWLDDEVGEKMCAQCEGWPSRMIPGALICPRIRFLQAYDQKATEIETERMLIKAPCEIKARLFLFSVIHL